MESKRIKKIKIPSDVHIGWERNFSFFGTFLQAEQHIRDIQAKLGVSFSMCAFFYKNDQSQFFRSQSDEENEAKIVGGRCLGKKGYSKEISKRLIETADSLINFMEKEKKLSERNIKKFFSLMNEHFVFHHAVFWSIHYLKGDNSGKVKESDFIMLQNARKYDEKILPRTEKWILKNNPEILFLTPSECLTFFAQGNKKFDRKSSRNKGTFVYIDNSSCILEIGKTANDLRREYIQTISGNIKVSDENLKGEIASLGKFKGEVKVIKNFKDFKKIKGGEVIVASMTIPDYNVFIKKAGAIITDEGLALSHAAIIAREFKIPCIVGTKIATRVLKDGDEVEVDAEKGVVKLIKKSN